MKGVSFPRESVPGSGSPKNRVVERPAAFRWQTKPLTNLPASGCKRKPKQALIETTVLVCVEKNGFDCVVQIAQQCEPMLRKHVVDDRGGRDLPQWTFPLAIS